MFRDAGRIRFKMPNIDVDGDGSAGDDANAGFVCITGNFSWSGFKRQSIKTTCTEAAVDGWDNIIHQFKAGGYIDLGSISFDVDWDASDDNIVHAAFRNRVNRDYEIHFPAEEGETTGPVITIPGHFTDFKPMTEALAEGDTARSRASVTIKIAADWTITPAS
jgi:hypothetical protein